LPLNKLQQTCRCSRASRWRRRSSNSSRRNSRRSCLWWYCKCDTSALASRERKIIAKSLKIVYGRSKLHWLLLLVTGHQLYALPYAVNAISNDEYWRNLEI